MKIKIDCSGGFAGISTSSEIDGDKLPTSIRRTVRDLLDGRNTAPLKTLGKPKGAADYLNYRITIQDGPRTRVIECDDYGLQDTLRPLVSYVQKNSKKS